MKMKHVEITKAYSVQYERKHEQSDESVSIQPWHSRKKLNMPVNSTLRAGCQAEKRHLV